MSTTVAEIIPKNSTPEKRTSKPHRAKLFMSGSSQAVRLPKEFRFEGTEVEIRRDEATGAILLQTPASKEKKSWQEFFDRLDALDIPEEMFVRETHIPVERDLF
jgi:antitoxin VapB